MSVSTQAWMIGSQWSRCHRSGSPISCGRSGIEMPVKPRSALRWISATAASGSLRNAMPSGMMRVGCARYHSSYSQSFQRADARLAELGVIGVEEHAAAEAGDHRREVHRRPHAVDVHVAYAGVDVVATGPHLVEAERLLLLRGFPAGDRVHPDLGELLVLELPDLETVAVRDSRRAVLEVRGEASLEGVRRLDDVVVDRDHRVLHLTREGFGEEEVFGGCHTYSQRCSGSGPARALDALHVEPDRQQVLHVERVGRHCRTDEVVVDLEPHAVVLLREALALVADGVDLLAACP